MTIVLQLDEAQYRRLQDRASELNIDPHDLAKAAINDLVSKPADDFERAATAVLNKNRELYRRLSQ